MTARATELPTLTDRPKILAATIGATVVAAVFAADQISKALAVTHLANGPTDPPGPFWFRLVANRGALMGFPLPSWLLLAGTVLVAAMAVSALARNAPRKVTVGWGLIVGGAAGNLADRFQHRPRFPDHAVVDWVASPSLPTFNLADVAIVLGLAVVTLTATASIQTNDPAQPQEPR